jgi:hypothetical protein
MRIRLPLSCVLVLVTACSATIRISRDELQDDLAKQFPREIDKHVFTLRASEPRVEFPGLDLLAVRLRLEAMSASGNSRLAGNVRAAGRIEYVAAEQAFYLRDPKVTELTMDHASSISRSGLVERGARAAVEELLRRHPVYRLDPRRSKDAKAIRHLRSVRIEDQELVLEVGL